MSIKTWIFGCACIVVVAVLLSGCIGQKTQTVPEPAPSVFVEYQRTGGIAGMEAHLVIFDNGAGVISGRSANTDIVLNKTAIDRISALLNDAQFSMLQTNYPAPRGGADLVKYSISYRGKTVTVEDTAIPPAIQPVLDELNRIAGSAGTQKTDYPFVSVKL